MEQIMAMRMRRKQQKEERQIAAQGLRERNELVSELAALLDRITVIENSFNLDTESDLIEADIYELESLRRRYSHLIKQAKARQIAAF